MLSHFIGETALNISLVLYIIWFIPQLILTAKRHSTAGLSLGMHSLLMAAYITDFMYGFGRHFPIQYKIVTLFGLSMLMIEHSQFLYYGLKQTKVLLHSLTIFFILFFMAALYFVKVSVLSQATYDALGFLSWICWLAYLWPQLIKNFMKQSTLGCSLFTIWIAMMAGVCDSLSAFLLDWDWPSKLGATIGLLPKAMLLAQGFYYSYLSRDAYAEAV